MQSRMRPLLPCVFYSASLLACFQQSAWCRLACYHRTSPPLSAEPSAVAETTNIYLYVNTQQICYNACISSDSGLSLKATWSYNFNSTSFSMSILFHIDKWHVFITVRCPLSLSQQPCQSTDKRRAIVYIHHFVL